MPTEKSSNKLSSEVVDKHENQKRQRRLQDPLPLEGSADAKAEIDDAGHLSNRKANEVGERTKHSDPAAIPHSRSFFQHDDRGTASQDGRRSGRRVTSERGWWKDSKDEEQSRRRTESSNVQEKEGKSLVRGGDDHAWRHDRFHEVNADANPPAKKRRQFREEKLPLACEPAVNAASEPSKAARPIERREERARDRRPLERSEHDRVYARERSFSIRERGEKYGFPPRDRLNGGDNGGKYKGRDRFGGSQGYRSNGGRVEKWKHDMFDEANRSPPPKTEEDPVAKVEALLAL